jgi:hypothetical protein
LFDGYARGGAEDRGSFLARDVSLELRSIPPGAKLDGPEKLSEALAAVRVAHRSRDAMQALERAPSLSHVMTTSRSGRSVLPGSPARSGGTNGAAAAKETNGDDGGANGGAAVAPAEAPAEARGELRCDDGVMEPERIAAIISTWLLLVCLYTAALLMRGIGSARALGGHVGLGLGVAATLPVAIAFGACPASSLLAFGLGKAVTPHRRRPRAVNRPPPAPRSGSTPPNPDARARCAPAARQRRSATMCHACPIDDAASHDVRRSRLLAATTSGVLPSLSQAHSITS